MFTITGTVVGQSPLLNKNKEAYANEVQIMTDSGQKKFLFGVKDFDLSRQWPEKKQVTLAVHVKVNTFNGRSNLEVVALEDQKQLSQMFKDTQAV